MLELEERLLHKVVVMATGPMLSGKTCMVQCVKRIFSWQGWRTKLITAMGYIQNGCNKKNPIMMDMIDIDNIEENLGNSWDVVIFDGLHSTRHIRKLLKKKIEKLGYQAIYLEIIPENEKEIKEKAGLVASTICHEENLNKSYEEIYNELIDNSKDQIDEHEKIDTSENISFISVGENGKVHAHNIVGEIGTKIAMIVMTVNTACHKKIFLVQGNNKIDLDVVRETISKYIDLSSTKVWVDPHLIPDDLTEKIHPNPLYISRLSKYEKSTTERVCTKVHFKGIRCDHPSHYKEKDSESYQTLIDYLEGLIIELLGEDSDILVLCDAAVARCIYGFFMDIQPKKIPVYPICNDFIIMIEQRLHTVENGIPIDGSPFQFVHFCLFSTKDVQKKLD